MKNTDDAFPSQMQPLNPKASSDRNSLLSTGFQATTTTYNSIEIRKNNLDEEESIAADSQQEDAHKTTVYQTFVHLLKGYMVRLCTARATVAVQYRQHSTHPPLSPSQI